MLGRGAERIRDDEASTILGRPAGETLSMVASAGLAGTVAEAGLLHFRGAFHNPGMFLPVVVPPTAAGLLATTIFRSGELVRRGETLPEAYSAARLCRRRVSRLRRFPQH